jgi:hypothetical protein
MVDASTIAAALGLRRSGRAFTGACPNCGYRGFVVRDRDGRTLLKCHAGGCEQREVLEALRSQSLWGVVPGTESQGRDYDFDAPAMKTDFARQLWRGSIPAQGSAVETYLASRGLEGTIPPSLRFLSDCSHKPTGTRWPAMIAAVTEVSGRVVGVHRTYLARDGRGKAPIEPNKMTLGPVAGAAVHLAAPGPTLVVGEGIESTLSAMRASGLLGWAALSTAGLRTLILPPLPIAAEVVIAADHDRHGQRQGAAYAAADRWLAEGRRVRIALPPRPDTDFNDLITEAAP